ncbi:MAG: hypothetical protein E5W69_01135 [Mesorhizobium sp.]|nr:MAG: hypothetical protein E5W69_01135 [Mesorhizobium sp.]
MLGWMRCKSCSGVSADILHAAIAVVHALPGGDRRTAIAWSSAAIASSDLRWGGIAQPMTLRL